MIDRILAPELWRYLGGVVKARGAIPYIVNGVRDHVHLLTSLPTDVAVGTFVGQIKGGSSHWVTSKRGVHFARQNGYSAFSVSRSNVDRTRKYIENQEAHHNQVSFQEELAALLRRHRVKFDESYVGRGGLK